MTLTEKVLKALESAECYLENSLSALKKDKKSFADSMWHVAAELEYALFLFSLMSDDEYYMPKWKPNPEAKKIGVEEMLTTVKELLRESKKALAGKDLTDAHKCTYMARQYIFKVQEGFTKKRYENSEK